MCVYAYVCVCVCVCNGCYGNGCVYLLIAPSGEQNSVNGILVVLWMAVNETMEDRSVRMQKQVVVVCCCCLLFLEMSVAICVRM